jgi:hypothetical protein
MDPKELAKMHEEKNARIAAAVAEKKAQVEAQKVEDKKRVEQGRTALREVVIPYFKEIQAAFPKGDFKFNSAAKVDLETRTPVAVSFQMKHGFEHVIEVIRGNVKIYRRRPGPPQRPGVRKIAMPTEFVFAGDAEPFIAGPSDLTREKLGKLVEIAIKEP